MRHAVRRSLVVLSLAPLSAFVVAGWVPVLPPSAGEPAAPRSPAAAAAAGIDVNAIVDTMRHRVTPVPDRPNALIGVRRRVPGRVRRSRLRPGNRPRSIDVGLVDGRGPGRWTSDRNTAERVRGDGITERVTARDGELEWDLVLATRPSGTGDFRAEAQLTGVTRVEPAGRRAPTLARGRGDVADGPARREGRSRPRAVPGAARGHRVARVALVVPRGARRRPRTP